MISFMPRPFWPQWISHGTHVIGGWFGHEAGVYSGGEEESLYPRPEIKPRFPSRPAL
jgi:hypothetical protein